MEDGDDDAGAATDAALPPGTQVGAYKTERVLGTGGFGTVYRAQHAVTRKGVALKLLHASIARAYPDVVRRFRREASVTNELECEHIVDVLDFGAALLRRSRGHREA